MTVESAPPERDLVVRFVADMDRLLQSVGREMSDSMHGVGCYIKDPAGVVVDVDVAADGETMLFEAGRVQQYARSVGERTRELEAIGVALRQLSEEGFLVQINEIGHAGRYAVAGVGVSLKSGQRKP